MARSVGLRQSAVIGWRGWRVARWRERANAPLVAHLIAPFSGEPWPRGVTRAACGRGGDHPSPDWECSCGIYAANDPSQALWECGGLLVAPAAIGRVRGWGRVIKHEFGWRAEFAQVEVLFFKAGQRPDLRDPLEQWYEAPVLEADWAALPVYAGDAR